MSQETANHSYKDTLQLPQTDFPIRPNHAQEQIDILNRWNTQGLYKAAFEKNSENKQEPFILIDGPPYANGSLHLGHTVNKILKDIAAKSKRMIGFHVPVTPGWDCHGLPIELKVSQENPGLKGLFLQKACRSYAAHWIEIQKEEFKQLGILMNWGKPYYTMDYSYEADTIRAFGILTEKGFIQRKKKTVPWCFSCKTVLATAEIEYHERKDPSTYILYKMVDESVAKLFPQLKDKELFCVVWTTTPWTTLLTQAIVTRPHTDYVLLEWGQKYIAVAKDLAQTLCEKISIKHSAVSEFSSALFASERFFVENPLILGFKLPLIVDSSVLIEEGTAFVSNAPGAGPEDYEVGIRHGIAIYCPVSAGGTMTDEIKIKSLIGKSIPEVQEWAIATLEENNRLISKSFIKHSYPHCWRCRNGLIFRATKQWFCDLTHDNLQKKSVDSIDSIEMLPEGSEQQFKATVASRTEWCLSRQRSWGTPIPAVLCSDCSYIKSDKEFIDTVALYVEKSGVEWWTQATLKELGFNSDRCSHCSTGTLVKEYDILDVWFDAGISHTAVIAKQYGSEKIDLFLEGKDQHRGYFQSSLLTSVALYNKPCMKTIITHGFTVDEKGRKMSKSLGNGVAPETLIKRLGVDGVRLWVSSVDLSSEVVVSEKLLSNVQEVYRKIRNTCRFLLSNLFDFNNEVDCVEYENLLPIDKIGLKQSFHFESQMKAAYDRYDFTGAFHLLADYTSVQLSSFYLDIIKDRLYVEKKDGLKRRSAQTVCYHILDSMTKLMAPILSFTAELVSDEYQKNKSESIHLQNFSISETILKNDFLSQLHELWVCLPVLLTIRSAILKRIELLRQQQIIRHSLEAKVTFYVDAKKIPEWSGFISVLSSINSSLEHFFAEFLIVSQVHIVESSTNLDQSELDGLWVSVQKAEGQKCLRCWQWQLDVEKNLCKRCFEIVQKCT